METIKVFFNNIFESYSERIKNPFIGSFILSFIFFNWRPFVFFIFSDWPVHCKIERIEELYFKEKNIWYPVIIALLYITVLPYVNLFFDFILSYYSKANFKRKNSTSLAELTQKTEEAKKEREIADAKAGTSEINNLQVKIHLLQQEINDLNDQYKADSQRWSERSSLAINKESDLNKSIDNLINENSRLKNTIDEILDNKKQKDEKDYERLQDPDVVELAFITLKKTTVLERKALITLFGNGQENKTYLPSNLEVVFLNRLTDLGLVKNTNDMIEITTLGKLILTMIQI
jgi:hypothetical protein